MKTYRELPQSLWVVYHAYHTVKGYVHWDYLFQNIDGKEVYKILHDIDKIDKNKLSEYTATRGHSLKLFKRRSRLKIRENSFSNRVVDTWNSLPEQIVQAPYLNCFKTIGGSTTHLSSTQLAIFPGQTTSLHKLSKCVWKRQRCLMFDLYNSKNMSNVRIFKEVERKKWGMFMFCYVFGQLSSVKRLA